MLFPIFNTKGKLAMTPSQSQVIEFKGYDTQNVIDNGSMREMKNLSSDEYPSIIQRKQRGIYADLYTDPQAIFARNEKLAVCDATSFWYDGERAFDFDTSHDNRRMVAINTRIVIFPDKMFYNTETGEYGYLEATVEPTSVTFSRDSTTHETCATFTLASGDTLNDFKKGDAISFRGMSTSIVGYYSKENNNIKGGIIQKIDYDNNEIWFADGVINYPTSDYQDFSDTGESSDGFTIIREVPDLDFVLEYNNRLYGTVGNTIMACKLGDPTNWYYYGTGTADSSYAVDVATDGEFTGIAPYPTHIIFFKENCMHKLYGYKPSNYQLITSQCMGVEKGSDKSIQLINGSLFYKSREGIMVYSGDLPYCISKNFGKAKYENAVSGTDGMKYYVSMRDKSDSQYRMFVFDIDHALWYLEDNTHASAFVFLGDELLFIDGDKDMIMSVIGNDSNAETEPIEWFAKFGDYDEYIENKKVYSKIEMRMKMEENSQFSVWISVDGGAWENVYHLDTHFKRTVEMPIVPRRCDKFAILITGKGYVKIESMVRVFREGTMR